MEEILNIGYLPYLRNREVHWQPLLRMVLEQPRPRGPLVREPRTLYEWEHGDLEFHDKRDRDAAFVAVTGWLNGFRERNGSLKIILII